MVPSKGWDDIKTATFIAWAFAVFMWVGVVAALLLDRLA